MESNLNEQPLIWNGSRAPRTQHSYLYGDAGAALYRGSFFAPPPPNFSSLYSAVLPKAALYRMPHLPAHPTPTPLHLRDEPKGS